MTHCGVFVDDGMGWWDVVGFGEVRGSVAGGSSWVAVIVKIVVTIISVSAFEARIAGLGLVEALHLLVLAATLVLLTFLVGMDIIIGDVVTEVLCLFRVIVDDPAVLVCNVEVVDVDGLAVVNDLG